MKTDCKHDLFAWHNLLLLLLFFVTSNSTRKLDQTWIIYGSNLIIITRAKTMDNSLSLIHAKTSKQYASTSTREFFFSSFKKIFIDSEREVLKVCKDKIKMVLQVILRRKTTSSVKIFICRESLAHAIARAETTFTSFAHNLAKQKNWIFLLEQISPSASSIRDLGTRLPILKVFLSKNY